jgi:hypothetical protein
VSPVVADIVAKVFLGWRTKTLRAADAFSARRREGPYRLIQNRSRTSVVALKSDAAAEKSKDQLWRDFRGFSIFDFCNNIGTFETCRRTMKMSASLIGRLGSSTFRLSTTIAVLMSLTGSCFSSESAPGPFHHGIRRRGGTILSAALPSVERRVQADIRTHLIHRPARDIYPPLGGARVFSSRV